jgi:hypothetical protein
MPHHVYANGNEIAAISADGASVACQPDVCFSPGAPMPGVPVPYPNSVFARDLTNVSRTVFLKDKGAALEDKSYFATSYGNEPATPGLKKGTVSGVIKGKGYFRTWSMNVKIEGLGVARHLDTVTHNHGNPANGMVQKYRSIWAKESDCENDRRTMKTNCEPEKEDDKKKRLKASKSKFSLNKLGDFAHDLGKKTTGAVGAKTDKNGWIRDHCEFLGVKPVNGVDGFDGYVNELKGLPEKLAEQLLKPLDTLKNKLIQELEEKIAKKAAEMAATQAAKAGLKRLVGALSWATGPIGGAIVNGALVASDIYSAAQAVQELRSSFPELKQAIDQVASEAKKIAAEVTDIKKVFDRYNGPDGAQTMMSDFMEATAHVNPCIRARKCQLVPYNKTGTAASQDGGGCCPGQTGHHLIYDSWMDGAGCSKYSHGTAPNVCVEGTDQRHGSHGKIHDATDERIKNATQGSPGKPPTMALDSKGRMSYKDAKKHALDAFQATFPDSGCNRKCLEKQLDEYYKNACSGQEPKLRPTDKNGEPYIPPASSAPSRRAR